MNNSIALILIVLSLLMFLMIVMIAIFKRNFVLFLFLFLAYLYTVYGFTIILYEEIFGKIIFGSLNFQYDYLFVKMFNLTLNNSFLISMIASLIFIFVLSTISGIFVKNIKIYKVNYVIIKSRAFFLLLLLIFISAVIVISNIDWNAIASNTENIYTELRYRNELPIFYSIHQLAIRAALFISLLSIFESMQENSITYKLFKVIPLLLLLLYCALLGNRAELISTFFMFCTIFAMQVRISGFHVILASFSLIVISLIGSLRGLKLNSYVNMLDILNPLNGFWNIISSNEFFAPILSLYGVIEYDVKPSYLISINWLIYSIIPRDFGIGRPLDSYSYYANNSLNDIGQGYAIHHITSYYINFGYFGILLCAIILSFILIFSFSIRNKEIRNISHKNSLFKLWLPAFVIGLFPSIIRGGIEGYKGLILEGIFIPHLIIIFLVRKFK